MALFDVIFPTSIGLVFLLVALLSFMRGAAGVRAQIWYAERYKGYTLYRFLPKRLQYPLRWWPERYDSLAAVIGGIIGLLMAAIFFGIAISVALD